MRADDLRNAIENLINRRDGHQVAGVLTLRPERWGAGNMGYFLEKRLVCGLMILDIDVRPFSGTHP